MKLASIEVKSDGTSYPASTPQIPEPTHYTAQQLEEYGRRMFHFGLLTAENRQPALSYIEYKEILKREIL